jgi:hypothetical protein
VHQRHVTGHFGKDDVYVDLHLSKVRFTPADEALFEPVICGLHVTKVSGP